MADQTMTVTIPATQTVVAAMGIIMTHEGRVVIGNNTSPIITANATDPKVLFLMLELARNEINKSPSNDVPFRAANQLVRS
jgi:hypothetical protein